MYRRFARRTLYTREIRAAWYGTWTTRSSRTRTGTDGKLCRAVWAVAGGVAAVVLGLVVTSPDAGVVVGVGSGRGITGRLGNPLVLVVDGARFVVAGLPETGFGGEVGGVPAALLPAGALPAGRLGCGTGFRSSSSSRSERASPKIAIKLAFAFLAWASRRTGCLGRGGGVSSRPCHFLAVVTEERCTLDPTMGVGFPVVTGNGRVAIRVGTGWSRVRVRLAASVTSFAPGARIAVRGLRRGGAIRFRSRVTVLGEVGRFRGWTGSWPEHAATSGGREVLVPISADPVGAIGTAPLGRWSVVGPDHRAIRSLFTDPAAGSG